MAHRHAWRTGCLHHRRLDVPVAGGAAEVLLLAPRGEWHGTVLAVHGYACNRTIPHLILLQECLRRGLGVASVPLPGHHPKAPPLHVESLTDYLPAVIAGLKPQLPAPIRLVLGNSLGSALLLLAMPHLEGVGNGILLQPPLRLDWSYAATLTDFRTSFDRSLGWAMGRFPWTSALSFVFARPRIQDMAGRHQRFPVLHPGMLPRLSAMFHHIRYADRLQQAEASGYLLIAGENDPVCPPDDVKAIARLVGGAPRVAVIPGCNHTTLFFVPTLLEVVSHYLDERFPGL